MAISPAPSTLTHSEVADLLQRHGPAAGSEPLTRAPLAWSYLDVRTPEEFATGHIAGAYNIPYQLGDLAGLHPHPEFVDLVTTTFRPAAPLIIGCRSGSRATAAARALQGAGFAELRVHLGSLAGTRDAFGRLEPGWIRAGYPLCHTALPGRTYVELRAGSLRPGPTSAGT